MASFNGNFYKGGRLYESRAFKWLKYALIFTTPINNNSFL